MALGSVDLRGAGGHASGLLKPSFKLSVKVKRGQPKRGSRPLGMRRRPQGEERGACIAEEGSFYIMALVGRRKEGRALTMCGREPPSLSETKSGSGSAAELTVPPVWGS